MTIFGWDASDYDWGRGPMDLGAAARDGITFFTHKATEDTNVKHLHFGEAMRRARDAGIPFLGAYHVVRSPRNAQAEVDYFLNYIDRSFPEWRAHPGFFLQVDLEKWPYDTVPASEGEDFADLAEAQTGKTAIIYASKGQYGNDLAGTSHPLWNAAYPLNYQAGPYRDLYARAGGDSGAGWGSYSGRVPQIWQFTSSADIGSQPGCDGNAFRGSEEDFRAMIGMEKKVDVVALPLRSDGDFDWLSHRLHSIAHMEDTISGGLGKGDPIQLVQAIKRIEVNTSASKATDASNATAIASLQAAVSGLLGMIQGSDGNVNEAALFARVQAASDEVRALVESVHQSELAAADQRHAELVAELRKDHAAEVEGLKAELAARSQ